MKEVYGKIYDTNGFYWAVMHRKHITQILPRGTDARRQVNLNNSTWEKQGWGRPWYVKRFRFYFKGNEIDAYEHEFERKEKNANQFEN